MIPEYAAYGSSCVCYVTLHLSMSFNMDVSADDNLKRYMHSH
jgi:hypothetical protein